MAVKYDTKNNDALTVYADQTSSQLYLKVLSGLANEAMVTVIDMNGQTVIERKIQTNQLTFIPLNNVHEGLYIARVKYDDRVLSEKFKY